MSITDVKVENKAKKDVNLATLIEHCKAEIESCQQRAKTLSKSLFLFDK
jgi:hypothetical protein